MRNCTVNVADHLAYCPVFQQLKFVFLRLLAVSAAAEPISPLPAPDVIEIQTCGWTSFYRNARRARETGCVEAMSDLSRNLRSAPRTGG